MTTTTAPTPVTNFDFAERVGVHHTMASRLRNGSRSPSTHTLIRVVEAYNLDCDQVMEWLDAIRKGTEASGAWLRENVFAPDTASLPAAG